MKDQVTTEFTHAYIEMPADHVAMWWQGVGVIVDLVRQLDALDVVAGATRDIAVDKKIPIFTLSLAQAATVSALGEIGSGMSDNTHYATSRGVLGQDQGVDGASNEAI